VLAQSLFDLGKPCRDLGRHVKAAVHVFGLGDLKAHDVFAIIGIAINSKARAVRSTVF